ncbi:MAG TPA: hypothetical protein VF281_00820 [Candidatus Saccharimonadales bacterium]
MTNHNTLTRSRDHHNPLHLTNRGRAVAAAGALVLGGVGIGIMDSQKSASHSIETQVDEQSIQIEHLIEKGPDDQALFSSIEQDDIPSIKIELATSDLNKIDNLGFVANQDFATWKSAKLIEEEVFKETGGSIQKDQKMITWRDNESGLILTTRYGADK